jgi:hypothetical protein
MAAARKLALAVLLAASSARPQASGPVITVDANGGVPKLEQEELAFVGDATAGVAVESVGGVLRGAISAYDATSRTAINENTRANGSLEPWFVTGRASDPFRFELRAVGEIAVYESTIASSQAGFFQDEDSLMWRGSLLAAARLRPGGRFFLALRLGGGVQYETYDHVRVPDDPRMFNSTDDTSFRGQGQLRARWIAAPEALSFRARLDASFFSITRDDLAVRLDQIGTIGVTSSQTTLRQIDASARVFVDIDALAVFGIWPAAFVGVDYFRLRSSAGTASSIVPVAGIGIFGFPGASSTDHDFE